MQGGMPVQLDIEIGGTPNMALNANWKSKFNGNYYLEARMWKIFWDYLDFPFTSLVRVCLARLNYQLSRPTLRSDTA